MFLGESEGGGGPGHQHNGLFLLQYSLEYQLRGYEL